jgi:hypothetical protein
MHGVDHLGTAPALRRRMHVDPSGLRAWLGLAGAYALAVRWLGRLGREPEQSDAGVRDRAKPALRLIHTSAHARAARSHDRPRAAPPAPFTSRG